jgi:xylulokinase
MDNSILIGLDVGTTSVKAAAYLRDGKLLAQAYHSYSTIYPHEGWAEQDPRDWTRSSATVLDQVFRQLGAGSNNVAGLALSTHAPGFIPVDKQKEVLLQRVPIWQDERSVKQAEDLLEIIGPDWVGLGMPYAAFPAKLRWFAENRPELMRRVKYALGVKAYVTHWLTGVYATDPSSEPGEQQSEAEIWNACGWSSEQLAPVLPATTVAGTLREDMQEKFGLTQTLPVVIGLNDGASSVLANGACDAGEAVLTLGTNGVIFLVADGPIPAGKRLDKAFFCWPYISGRWIVGGQNKAGACSLAWFSNLVCDLPAGEARIDSLLREAEGKPPGSNGVMCFPYLMGRGTPVDDPDAKAAFLGLSLQHDRGDIVRALLEGVAFTLKDVMEEFQSEGLQIKKLFVTGGGAKNLVWREILSQVLNRELHYSDADSALGAAMLAAVGTGVYGDIKDAQRNMAADATVAKPDRQKAERYIDLYGSYLSKRDLLMKTSD